VHGLVFTVFNIYKRLLSRSKIYLNKKHWAHELARMLVKWSLAINADCVNMWNYQFITTQYLGS